MTLKEIRKILDNTKVYVNGKSKEIQEKLFSFGYKWGDISTKIQHVQEPFLYIGNSLLFYGDNMAEFTYDKRKEITTDEILSLEITKPSYRPFSSQKECWNEMLKHGPMGWVKSIKGGEQKHICLLETIDGTPRAVFSDNVYTNYGMSLLFDRYTFADGTPFGILEN